MLRTLQACRLRIRRSSVIRLVFFDVAQQLACEPNVVREDNYLPTACHLSDACRDVLKSLVVQAVYRVFEHDGNGSRFQGRLWDKTYKGNDFLLPFEEKMSLSLWSDVSDFLRAVPPFFPGKPNCTGGAFNEDQSQTRKDYGQDNVALLRRFALSFIKPDSLPGSFKNRRKLAAWNSDALARPTA